MTKIDIISGFLGAGKTTLIKKLLKEAFQNEQVVLIENEFGEIGIDGGFLKEAGIEIREMNSGCICCSLVGDFGASLREVVETYHPDRILIEPSGVGKLSDVIKAVKDVQEETGLKLNSYTTVVDAKKCKMYMRNFGEFFNNQVEHAGTIILSRTDIAEEEKAQAAMQLLRKINEKAVIITTPIDQLDGKKLLEVIEHPVSLEQEMMEEEHHECGHHHGDAGCVEHHHGKKEHCGHHHHEEQHECGHHHGDAGCVEHHHGKKEHCGHHHHEEQHECGHHHGDTGCVEHHHGKKEHCGHHHHEEHHDCGHHHHHEEHHDCGHHHHHEEHHHCGHHHHHHDHHAEEVFTSWGHETVKKYNREALEQILEKLSDSDEFGMILRAKGMLADENGTWTYFDMVPGEIEIREGAPEYTGRFCVIGSGLKEEKLAELFHL